MYVCKYACTATAVFVCIKIHACVLCVSECVMNTMKNCERGKPWQDARGKKKKKGFKKN